VGSNEARRTNLANQLQGHEILTPEDRSGGKQTRHRLDPDLEISEHIWSDEAVRGLIDEWLVPSTVERVVRDLLNSGRDGVK
jgi:hypothetical protein